MTKAAFEMALWESASEEKEDLFESNAWRDTEKIQSGVSVGLQKSINELVEVVGE